MKFKFLGLVLFIGVTSTGIKAQDIKFDKKSGEFSAASGVIAKLEDEKVKSQGGKNYFLKDAAGQTELLAYTLHKWEDTMGNPTIYYFDIRCTPLGLTAFRPNFTMMSVYKEIGEIVTSKNLLLTDGKINEPAMKAYFAAAQAEMGDYTATLKRKNDSMAALVSIDAPPVDRDTRKPVTANEYGKIGQGNTVIGTWEFIENKGEGLNSSTYNFRVKNLAGGIICISWITLGGSHTYIYKGGVRSKDDWKVTDLVNNNPIQHKQEYVVELATRLIRAGLL